jgi:molybdenum transport protein
MHFITDDELDQFIREDLPYGDLTTRSLGLSDASLTIEFRARSAMIASSTEEAARIMTRLGCEARVAAASGASVAAGELLASAHGRGEAVFGGWKVAQVLMEYASGIATAAARIVALARAERPDVVIACTRKTIPGAKAVAIKAIVAGGATPHRLGLSDSILVFPEHCALLGDRSTGDGSMAGIVGRLKARCPEKKVVVEVATPDDADEASAAGADVVQLEKFPPELVAEVVERVSGRGTLVAAAGGVTAANAARYAQAGARLLVTSAPYSAPPMDVKVTIARRQQ